MNYIRLVLAAFGGTVASFIVGALVMVLVPALFEEARKYPAVFRPKEEMMATMPFGLVASLVGAFVVAVLYAMMPATGIAAGLKIGALAGVLMVCGVMHNYANYNIGLTLALGQAVAYFVQWVVVGVVVSLIYRHP